MVIDTELPIGYKRVLGFACNNNAFWEIADFHLRGSDTVRVSFSVTNACNVFGCYQSASATDNYDLYAATTANSYYLRYGSEKFLSSFVGEDIGKRFDVVFSPTGSVGMPVDSTWTSAEFEAAKNLLIGNTAITSTSAKMRGNFYGDFIVDGRLHLIPCERANDGVLGYYDTYGKTFYEPYTGFDGAVSLGYDHSHEITVTNFMATESDLTAIANAIRTKGGTSAALAFPAGFVSAVQAIPSGSSWSWDDYVNGTFPSGACVLTSAVTTIPADRFKNNKVVTSVDAPGVTLVESNAFNGCSNLESVNLPACTTVGYTTNSGSTARIFSGINGGKISAIHLPACIYAGGTLNFEGTGTAQNPVTVVLPAVTLVGTSAFQTAKLAAVDFGPDFPTIYATLFSNATVPIIILRRSSDLVTLANTNAFNGSTFKSGGTGGTIYIPKVLYDHLGDGTALDYKAATNWSTIDGYGTITWAKIEGSIYETKYADGTTIPTT